ncbi:MAG TPA: hypothetical protein VM843_05205 [Flavisolibacter sp.]|jgi:protein ImuA|nr:hypothetical protein [Flavisolibacter sp.]
MTGTKSDIKAQLQKEIFSLQGCKRTSNEALVNVKLGGMEQSFPGGIFPLGGVHEFLCNTPEIKAASSGFIAGIASSLMQKEGVVIWIGPSRKLFPPALKAFGIQPHNVIFINVKREQDLLWVMEETLKCAGLAAVVAEMKTLSFTTSRRLQLAVESSGVSGFILRSSTENGATACLTRWQVKPLASDGGDALPGLGFPRWSVDLLKVRNGTPGSWKMEWAAGSFRKVHEAPIALPHRIHKKIV